MVRSVRLYFILSTILKLASRQVDYTNAFVQAYFTAVFHENVTSTIPTAITFHLNEALQSPTFAATISKIITQELSNKSNPIQLPDISNTT